MERIWMQKYVIDVTDTSGSHTVALPQIRDVALREDGNVPGGFPAVWLAAKDGTLWQHGAGMPPSSAGQQPSPGGIAGVAVALNDTLWAVTTHGVLWWRLADGSWHQVPPTSDNKPLTEVTVHRGAVWVVAEGARMWRTRDGKTFEYQAVFASFARLSGRNNGEMWGLTTDGWLWHQDTNGVWWNAEGGKDQFWVDVSVSYEGTVWLVARDGTVWTTTDGTAFLKRPGEGFSRIAAGRYEVVWAVKADGTLWLWQQKPATPPPPPPPLPPPPAQTPPPPAPSDLRPQISVSTTGSGQSSVFHVKGSRFVPQGGGQVTIRGARIGDGQVFNYYWTTQSSGGAINADLGIPSVPGVQISFSANDGRPDPTDHTDRFWSNTVTVTAP